MSRHSGRDKDKPSPQQQGSTMNESAERLKRITTMDEAMDEAAADALIGLLREAYTEPLATERAHLIEEATTSFHAQLRRTDVQGP